MFHVLIGVALRGPHQQYTFVFITFIIITIRPASGFTISQLGTYSPINAEGEYPNALCLGRCRGIFVIRDLL